MQNLLKVCDLFHENDTVSRRNGDGLYGFAVVYGRVLDAGYFFIFTWEGDGFWIGGWVYQYDAVLVAAGGDTVRIDYGFCEWGAEFNVFFFIGKSGLTVTGGAVVKTEVTVTEKSGG